jgi:hypothetical protein
MSLFRPFHWYHSRGYLIYSMPLTLSDESVAKFYPQKPQKGNQMHIGLRLIG